MKKGKRKSLGQHFLKDRTALRKIVKVINPQPEDLIIEIGGGKGVLTFPLAQHAGKVISVEKDKSFIPLLERKGFLNLTILGKDILKINFKELINKELTAKKRIKLVGNLPYQISSPLLFMVLTDKDLFSECIFLLQREVAERICAQPGVKKYAPLSIFIQIYFKTKLHFILSPKSFAPPPRVESALVSLKKRDKPLFFIEKEEAFRKFLKEAFLNRRKTLHNNLIRLGYPPAFLRKVFQKFDLANSLRAEQITIAQFVDLFISLNEDSTEQES